MNYPRLKAGASSFNGASNLYIMSVGIEQSFLASPHFNSSPRSRRALIYTYNLSASEIIADLFLPRLTAIEFNEAKSASLKDMLVGRFAIFIPMLSFVKICVVFSRAAGNIIIVTFCAVA